LARSKLACAAATWFLLAQLALAGRAVVFAVVSQPRRVGGEGEQRVIGLQIGQLFTCVPQLRAVLDTWIM
jgi:hypothetical protein